MIDTGTKQKINDILVETLQVSDDEIKPTATVMDDLGADSLDMVQLCQDLEEAFDIKIIDADGEQLETVQDVYDMVAEKLA
jgi:acyl carrier protein